MSIFQQAAQALSALTAQAAGVSITYARKNVTPVTLTATVGHSTFELDNGDGIFERMETRDYLLPAASLVLGSQQLLPQKGDQISEVQGTQTYVYRVTSPGNEPHYRFSDSMRTILRIHTILVTNPDK